MNIRNNIYNASNDTNQSPKYFLKLMLWSPALPIAAHKNAVMAKMANHKVLSILSPFLNLFLFSV